MKEANNLKSELEIRKKHIQTLLSSKLTRNTKGFYVSENFNNFSGIITPILAIENSQAMSFYRCIITAFDVKLITRESCEIGFSLSQKQLDGIVDYIAKSKYPLKPVTEYHREYPSLWEGTEMIQAQSNPAPILLSGGVDKKTISEKAVVTTPSPANTAATSKEKPTT